MPVLNVKVEGEGAWPDLAGRMEDVVHLRDDTVIEVVGLEGGMTSGRASVAFRFDLPDGKVVIAETSLGLFLLAADILKVHYGK